MKKITLLFTIVFVALCASGVYAYSEGMLDDLMGTEEEDDDSTPVASTGLYKQSKKNR